MANVSALAVGAGACTLSAWHVRGRVVLRVRWLPRRSDVSLRARDQRVQRSRQQRQNKVSQRASEEECARWS